MNVGKMGNKIIGGINMIGLNHEDIHKIVSKGLNAVTSSIGSTVSGVKNTNGIFVQLKK